VIERQFHGFVSAETVGSSGHYSNFVVETFDSAGGNLAFGAKPIQQEFLMGTKHPSHFLHRLQTAAHGAKAPVVEKGSCPDTLLKGNLNAYTE
jgi:hypothetical protein